MPKGTGTDAFRPLGSSGIPLQHSKIAHRYGTGKRCRSGDRKRGLRRVVSISWSDQAFSALASSFACTLVHSRPLWRGMCFSKRVFSTLSSCVCCAGDNSFFDIFLFFHVSKCPLADHFHHRVFEFFADGDLGVPDIDLIVLDLV